eukprot:168354_1
MGKGMKRKRVSTASKQYYRDDRNSAPLLWNESRLASDSFLQYYVVQKLVPKEEWETLFNTLMTGLPTTFWISNMHNRATHLKALLGADHWKMHDFEATGATVNGLRFQAPRSLVWYPESRGGTSAWYSNVPKRIFKDVESLRGFRAWLTQENETGGLNRQEAVSMIPPLLLDVRPHHRVLDMCAAPGSKTAQMVEDLHREENVARSEGRVGPRPTGLVVANDDNPGRSYMLVHQIKRLNSPNFVTINHKAQFLPNLQLIGENGGDSKEFLRFDRILCDVPCSGDGTIRKSAKMHWKKWKCQRGNGLHGLQLQIAVRGVQLLRPGGVMVYSTCSFNPVEDEAVVAELLKRFKGSLEIVDVSDRLPKLKRRPGMATWKVCDHDGTWYSSFADVPKSRKRKLPESMFPPPESSGVPLERCLRLLPHLQDTGGFFVAVLQKKESAKEEKVPTIVEVAPSSDSESKVEEIDRKSDGVDPDACEVESEAAMTTDDVQTSSPSEKAKAPARGDRQLRTRKAKRQGGAPRPEYDPYLQLPGSIARVLKDFYGFSDDFPFENLFSRTKLVGKNAEGNSPKEIYVLPPVGAALLRGYSANQPKPIENGENETKKTNKQPLAVVHAGLRVFSRVRSGKGRVDPGCPYRITQDGVQFASPFMSKQVVPASSFDLLSLLANPEKKLAIAEFRNKVSAARMRTQGTGGSVVMRLCVRDTEAMVASAERGEVDVKDLLSACDATLANLPPISHPSLAEIDLLEDISLVGWKSINTVLHMISKLELDWTIRRVAAHVRAVRKRCAELCQA